MALDLHSDGRHDDGGRHLGRINKQANAVTCGNRKANDGR
jgi:hypothetical protein